MGRVGDDDVRLGHIPHHAAHRHLHLQLADLALYLGLALAVPELVLDLLLGHLELAIVVPGLEGHVYGDYGDQGAAEDDQHPQQQIQGIYDAAGEALEGEIEQVIELARQHPPGEQADEHHLGDGLDELHQGLHPEHPLQPTQGAQLAPLGQHGLGGEVHPAEQGVAHEGGYGHQQEQQAEGLQQLPQQGGQHDPHGVGIERLIPVQGKAHGEHLDHGARQALLDHQQAKHGRQQDAGGTQLLGTCNLPFFPGLLQSFARGLFCAFLIGISHAGLSSTSSRHGELTPTRSRRGDNRYFSARYQPFWPPRH